MGSILHIVLNGYTNDNRVRRAAECGRDLGHPVHVFALSADGFPEKSSAEGVQVRRFFLLTRSWSKTKLVQLLKYAELFMRMIVAGIALRPVIVHAHDVDGLPIGYLVAMCTRARLIYDAHELWADPAHAQAMPKWLARGLVQIERFFSRRAHHCITVSDSIARHMSSNQNIRIPTVIRNVPEPWPENPPRRLRSALGITAESVIILYQGAIGGEGVKTLAEAFRRVRGDATLVFLGSGPDVPYLKSALADLGPRVAFHPLVPANELPSFTGDADIGVHPMAAGFLNHLYALPNKLFEYIQGGLAVVTSDLPEMTNISKQYGIGIIFPPGDAACLARCLQDLVDDPELRRSYRCAAKEAAKTLNWQTERKKLELIYTGIARGN